MALRKRIHPGRATSRKHTVEPVEAQAQGSELCEVTREARQSPGEFVMTEGEEFQTGDGCEAWRDTSMEGIVGEVEVDNSC